MLTQKLSPRALAIAAFLAAAAWSAAPAAADDTHAAPPAAAPKPASPGAAGVSPTPKPTPTIGGSGVSPVSTPPAAKPAALKPTAAPKAKAPSADDNQPDVPRTAEEALKLLADGNERWVSGNTFNPHTGIMRRKMTADNGQMPYAAVLSCVDSRAPIERLFDAGVGDIFTVRVAGNISGPHQAGSLEYGVDHLGIPLLVVMGHTKCGAVRAAAESAPVQGGGPSSPRSNIDSLLSAIKPAVERARKMNPSADPEQLAAAAARENVWQSIFDLYKTSPEMIAMVRSGKVKVVGALVDVSTGKVDWMGEHPWQDAILSAFTPAAPAPGGTGNGGAPSATVPAPAPTKIATPEPAAPH